MFPGCPSFHLSVLLSVLQSVRPSFHPSRFRGTTLRAAPSKNYAFSTNLHACACVADPSREGRNRDNSWLQFNRLFNNRGTASTTQLQSVGGNYSPASALKYEGSEGTFCR